MTSRGELTVVCVLGALFTGCAASNEELAREHAKLESLELDVPANWQRTDRMRSGVATATWQPEDNERKESVTVIRTELSLAVAQAGAVAIEPYLAHAQRSLPQARTSAVKRISTAKGLQGARVDVDFVPQGQHERYRRVHVVLVDGSSLVHILYTAQHPDHDLAALGVVLDNLHHTGA